MNIPPTNPKGNGHGKHIPESVIKQHLAWLREQFIKAILSNSEYKKLHRPRKSRKGK